jgi:hypothetical protein
LNIIRFILHQNLFLSLFPTVLTFAEKFRLRFWSILRESSGIKSYN